MGSHAKPRTTGRKTALGALALGATLTGVGLTAAALDPATAVLTANGSDEGGAIQLSGLSTPVSLDLTPAADPITDLTAAPLQPVSSLVGSAGSSGSGTSGASSRLDPVGSAVKSATSTVRSTTASTTGTENSIKPIVASAPTTTSTGTSSSTTPSSGTSNSSGSSTGSGSTGSGSSGATTQPRSAAPPSADSALSSLVTSTTAQVLPTVEGLVSKVPVVSSVVQDTGLLSAATTSDSTSDSTADPVSSVTGVVGSLPLGGSLLGGSGDGQSTVTVPGVSTLAGLL